MQRPSYSSWVETFALGILFLSFCLGYLSSQYNFDGTVFAFRVEKAMTTGDVWPLFHPRHIFYEPAGYTFCKIFYSLGSGARSVFWLAVMDTMFGFFCILLFHRLCLRLGLSRVLAAGLALCFAFSFGFWFFSMEPEVYVPGVFFLLTGFWFVLYFMERRKSGIVPGIVLGLLAALCIFNHIVNGLFLITLCVGALFYLGKKPGEERAMRFDFWSAFVLIAACFAIIIFVYYLVSARSPIAQDTGALRWFLGLADPETPFGYRKSYWAFYPGAGMHWLYGMGGALVAPEQYRMGQGKMFSCLGWLSGAILILLWIIYFVRVRKIPGKDRGVHILLWLWLLPYALFTLIWEPRNFELKVFLLAPLYLLPGLSLKNVSGKLRIIQAVPLLLAGLLFLTNFYSSILPGADEDNNLELKRAYFIRDSTEPLARIYIAGVSKGYNIGKIYIPYFSGRQALVMDWLLKDVESDEELEKFRIIPGAYVLEELIRPGPALDELSVHHGVSPEAIRQLFLKHNPHIVARHDKEFSIYRIQFH